MASSFTQGDKYEPYVGRWSRLVAAEFVDWLAVPAGRNWVDVGCGTGALTETVLSRATPASVVGRDASEGFVDHARRHVTDPRASFAPGDAQSLDLPDGSADAVVSGLVLNFVPEPERMVSEMARVTRDLAALYVWDYAGEMQLMRRFWAAAVARDPAAAEFDESTKFTLCQPDRLAALFGGAGLGNVQTRAIDVPTVFADFDDYWTPFLGGNGPAPAYTMSLEPAARDALREDLRESMPVETDGSIHLIARAWAIRGGV